MDIKQELFNLYIKAKALNLVGIVSDKDLAEMYEIYLNHVEDKYDTVN